MNEVTENERESRMTKTTKRRLIILGALVVAGVAVAGVMFAAFPVQMTTYGGIGRNYLLTLSMPAGTVSRRVMRGCRLGRVPRVVAIPLGRWSPIEDGGGTAIPGVAGR